ncbi:MAG: serine/threonine protein kinase [Kofleriaceae bacterium]|nr:serine/threonine protein kinase [Kofleriaceae bacterium]
MGSGSEDRSRTATRLRYVAPPDFGVDDDFGANTIGRYEVMETLGKGAMGIVYKARDPLLDRIVAVKTIMAPRNRGKRNRKSYLQRFEREAKAAAKMQHPAIVTIFDVGTEGNQPFMVLEYLPGDSLADRLDKVRIPLAKAVQIAIELAGALGFAHNERIVHRDVKTANVLSAGGNHWKLADFGIARMPDSDITQVGIFMGTPGYAPPEAIREGFYTPQADVFAWGAVLYELLSGRIPYEGPDTKTTNSFVMKNTAKSPRVHDASIPEALAEVCMLALHPATTMRYADGHAAKAALEEAWESCVESEVLSPKAFSSKEIPHNRVGKFMHRTVQSSGGGAGFIALDSLASTQGSNERFEGKSTHQTNDDDEPTIVMQYRGGESVLRPLNLEKLVGGADQERGLSEDRATNSAGVVDALVAETPKAGLWVSALLTALMTAMLGLYYVVYAT